MGKNGYVLGPYGVELKQGWINSISDRADKVFSKFSPKPTTLANLNRHPAMVIE